MRTILCYGDSNTWGRAPATSLTDVRRYEMRERWGGVLQNEIGPGYNIIEEGLRGRTTVWDDPVEGRHKNGLLYLLPCLESHGPIDIVVLFLGTNDLKKRFSVSSLDIALSIEVLIRTIQQSGSGPRGESPHIILLAPPPLGRLTAFADIFEGGTLKSRKLGKLFHEAADRQHCAFLDTSEIVVPSDVDGIHLEIKDHHELGVRVTQMIQRMEQDEL